MLIIKIAGIAFVALFLIIMLKQFNGYISFLLSLAAGVLMFMLIISPLGEVINFIKNMGDKAGIDVVYLGIILKIIGIAYITSFASSLCKDANVDAIATQINMAGKVMILVLAIPILMAVLNSVLQIMQ